MLKRRCPQKEKVKGRKKRVPVKQRQIVQVLEDTEFLNETDDAGMHWTEMDFTCLTRAWVTSFVKSLGRTKGFTFYQKENNAHKINQGLNGGNDFKYREAYKILAREPRWANLRDDRLNHAVNIPRNVARRTSDNSSPGSTVESNNLLEDFDGPPIPQSAGPNFDLDGSLYEGRSRPIGQKLYKKNLEAQKAMDGVAVSSSSIQTMMNELRLEKRQAKDENERRRVEAIQHWQAEVIKRLAKSGGPAWCRTQIATAQSKIILSKEDDDDDKPRESGIDESDVEEDI
ncbi:hypothetical protein GIB67_040703 [Kingdonia uniflora]|uniref:No apical meristem-associated C-terminal domain-containing protein n=1 Tax=Kingdonia uniflora TaxID=39325 RepID=A0A7J7KUA3_9MAGN|nr:hypothetical protein GIB67_040703 [Kingdonia uniflora]